MRVGGGSPVTAAFVPPEAGALPELIGDLLVFMARDDHEPLTQVALAHSQFETIHPFTDGNGRTGRALVAALLRRRGVTTAMTAPLSSGLLTDTEAYFNALGAYRAGDIVPIVTLFADAAESAVANARRLVDDAREIRDQVLAQAVRRTQAAEVMAEVCATEPAFNVPMLVARGLAPATAYRRCQQLTEAGCLRRERAIQGMDAWTVVPLTDALDAFARRAGRRTFNR